MTVLILLNGLWWGGLHNIYNKVLFKRFGWTYCLQLQGDDYNLNCHENIKTYDNESGSKDRIIN